MIHNAFSKELISKALTSWFTAKKCSEALLFFEELRYIMRVAISYEIIWFRFIIRPHIHKKFNHNAVHKIPYIIQVNDIYLKCLFHTDEDAQLAAIRLVQGMLKRLTADELLQLMPAVTQCSQLPAVFIIYMI